eukprot:TRINITY_DN1435_c0_g1_i15.p1 TRINITY_DN1435_c0_g1~~TRINITY_DN1435_c0_g1_i15.p1  ORF type:complete len:423 (-),score=79.98 TRINITY_DN1435_c0_g1_i15:32-1300(-)
MSASDPEQQLDEIVACCDKIIKYSTNQAGMRAKTLKDLQDILRVLMKSGSTKKTTTVTSSRDRISPAPASTKSGATSATSSATAAKSAASARKPSPAATRPTSAGKKPPVAAGKKKEVVNEVEDDEPPPYVSRLPNRADERDNEHEEENIRGWVDDHHRGDRDSRDFRDHRVSSERDVDRGPHKDRRDYDRRDDDRREHDRRDQDRRDYDKRDYDRRDDDRRDYDRRDDDRRERKDFDRDSNRNRGDSSYGRGNTDRGRRDYESVSPRDAHKRDNLSESGGGRNFMSALASMHGGPSDQDVRNAQQKREQMKREWEDQIREKKDREAREKERIRQLEEKEEREAAIYNPFGRGGAGAPMRDESGSIIASRKPTAITGSGRDHDGGYRDEPRSSHERRTSQERQSRGSDSYYDHDNVRENRRR